METWGAMKIIQRSKISVPARARKAAGYNWLIILILSKTLVNYMSAVFEHAN